jgi:hypothetical protein
MENNEASVGVYTDYGIATILSNFSEGMIQDIIKESLDYRFRPFGLRAPNYPEIIDQQLANVKVHSTGYDNQIEEQRVSAMNTIITTILDYYQLSLTTEIPDELLYSVCYILYQLFVSEFTERMTNFFTQYILNHIDSIINKIRMDNLSNTKASKNSYVKKIYNNQDLELVYENMGYIVDILAGLDIPFEDLIAYLSDQKTSDFITTYVEDTSDIYKNHFARFLIDQTTSADMITKIRLKYVEATIENKELLDPVTNPYIKEKIEY